MIKQISIYLLILAIAPSLKAESMVYQNVNDFEVVIEQLRADNPPKKSTLVVLDIDDTLLEAAHFVGSDKWYNWQKNRDSISANNKPLNISDGEKFNCISSLLGTFFELGSTHLTQPNLATILQQFEPYDRLLLTARTTSYRIPTERELAKFALNFRDSHLLDDNVGLLFDLNDGNRTAKVSYQHGVALASGLNKGKVLKALLQKVNKQYDYIYFVDDSLKNIRNMEKSWQNDKTMVKNFHFTRVDKSISKNEITRSKEIKERLEAFIQTAYPEKAKAFEQGECH
jgi:hypothetical protein